MLGLGPSVYDLLATQGSGLWNLWPTLYLYLVLWPLLLHIISVHHYESTVILEAENFVKLRFANISIMDQKGKAQGYYSEHLGILSKASHRISAFSKEVGRRLESADETVGRGGLGST